jgi:ribosome biogenesis GTPase A
MTAPQLSLRAQSLALLSAASSLHRSALPSARLPSEPVSDLSAFLTAGSGGEAAAFSAVVAGEFNAGKSTFVNALLGAPILASGPLPTTDSLCLISTAAPGPEAPAGPRFDPPAFSKRQHPRNVDVVHYELSHVYGEAASGESSLLSAVTLVDTPGTNAVAELRHDALTKRLLPAADVVLFVTSCERPLSQSERELLEPVEGWGKKTLVLLNKSDVLEGGQVEQVGSASAG